MTTIKSAREIETIFREGRREASRELTLLAKLTPEGRGRAGRVAFVAGKRLGSAVARNRCKRVMREAVREVGGPWDGWDVVVLGRMPAVQAPPSHLAAALRNLLRQGGIA